MRERTAEAAGAAIAGLVALHEHELSLRQERRLAGRPSFSDRVPYGLVGLILVGLAIYGLALLVAAVWPWLVALAVVTLGARVLVRRRRRRPGKSPAPPA